MFLVNVLLNSLFFKDIAVVIDIFKHKHVHNSVVSHCYDDLTTLLMYKKFNDNSLRISSKNKDKKNFSIPHFHQKIGIVVNTSCVGWDNIFSSPEFKDAFKSPYVWVIVTQNVTRTTEVLSQYKIELDSDVTVISKREKVYDLYEIFYTGFNKNGQFIVREIGRWNNVLYIEGRDRKDLKGLVLRCTVVIAQSQKVANKTFVRFLEEEQPDLYKGDPLHKFKFFAALKYLQHMFNISYDFQRTLSWGYHTNGTFDGMVGALQRKESDIGGSPIFIRADRTKALDYAVVTWQTRPCFVFRHPKHPGGFYTIYTRPLTVRVWYCIIALIVVSSAILGFLLKLRMIRVSGDDEDMSSSLAFLCIWSALCQQGFSIGRSSPSVKMVIFVTFLYSLTLYQYYNATVVSTLLREQPKNIRSLGDLVKSNLKAGVEDILYNKDYFRRTTDPLALQIYHKKVAHTTPYKFFSPEQGMALVKTGGFAFHVDSAVAYRFMRHAFSERELCEIQEVAMFVPQNLGAAVAKGSPYKEVVAYGIRKMKETGILSRLLSIWDEARPACVRTPDSSIFSVTLREFSSAIILLAVGYIVALTVFVGEMLFYRFERRIIEFRH